jgi:hypothetical protein
MRTLRLENKTKNSQAWASAARNICEYGSQHSTKERTQELFAKYKSTKLSSLPLKSSSSLKNSFLMTSFEIGMLCCAERIVLGTRESQGKVPWESTSAWLRQRGWKLISLPKASSIYFRWKEIISSRKEHRFLVFSCQTKFCHVSLSNSKQATCREPGAGNSSAGPNTHHSIVIWRSRVRILGHKWSIFTKILKYNMLFIYIAMVFINYKWHKIIIFTHYSRLVL